MKDPKIGEEVESKRGTSDRGVILHVFQNGKVAVQWRFQDGLGFSQGMDPKDLRRVPKPQMCPTCGRRLDG